MEVDGGMGLPSRDERFYMAVETGFIRKNLADQVAESLKESILNDNLPDAPNFPSSRVLARRYGISHNVMLKALKKLYDGGLICLDSKRQGYRLKQSVDGIVDCKTSRLAV
jgi:DNA-binding FadR family transcriptional regulator